MMNKTPDENQINHEAAVMSALEFARLGGGEVAYIKQIDSDQARDLFPTLTGLPEGIDFFAVVGADGTPLGITDSRDSAIASVFENELQPVSVH